MSDLVERLRERPYRMASESNTEMQARRQAEREYAAHEIEVLRLEKARQAARIQQLEAALREHACGCVDRCMEDREMYGEYTKFENATCSGARARAALGEKP